MHNVTHALVDWLSEKNLPIDGVRLIVEFPDRNEAYRAEMSLKQDVQPLMNYEYTYGTVSRLNGVALSIQTAKPQSR